MSMKVDIKSLLGRLNPYCKRALEGASGLCVNSGHYEVAVDHMLLQLLEDPKADAQLILKHNEIDPSKWVKRLQQEIESFRSGNPGKPVFSRRLLTWFEESWMLTSLNLGLGQLRSGSLLATLIDDPMRYGLEYLGDIDELTTESIKKDFDSVIEVSNEKTSVLGAEPVQSHGVSAPTGGTAIEKYTTNFTARAREGKIDPVFGREREIRQMVDILGRRRKNNPIAVGEAGVGKTAVVEGLALKVAEGDVPDIIKDVDIVGLDLGLLQAGASIKGEFENRLNTVITEIKSSEKPIILFIDEAHTLIGAGGAAGTGDAANLLKPALARGELRTVAATTWTEYKKYFEKDPALARRFQLVKLDEPSAENTAVILRGLRKVYEDAHDVYVRDDAITAAANLSARYITGRQLPDKAVDVLDTACARVKISLTTQPAVLEDLEKSIQSLEREKDALARDVNSGRSKDQERLELLGLDIEEKQKKMEVASTAWKCEDEAVKKVIMLRKELNEFDKGDSAEKPIDNQTKTKAETALSVAIAALEKIQSETSYIAYEVTEEVVARVISDWTGIQVGNIVKDEAASLLGFRDAMKGWVKGQDHAIDVIDSGIRTAKAKLQNPDQPLGVFLFVGPSGVGKTETALGVANLLFGGERFMTSINMSEYQEKHTVSRLVGSPAGYVGYGEGGILTEAVRQRPYSVVLLDEVEKADLEVMNLFYQVFDKGSLSDGEGRVIDFRNTIVFLTSNLASATIMNLCSGDVLPDIDQITEAIRPELQHHFKPALLARMTIIPYLPLKGEVLKSIVRIKLDKIGRRLQENHRLAFEYGDDVAEQIMKRCTDVESGARNIDHIVNKNLLPLISTEILQQIGSESNYSRLSLGLGEGGNFTIAFS